MNNFTEQHKAIEVLLGRFMRRTQNKGRVTLDGFVRHLKANKNIKSQLKGYGHWRLRKVVSHALEAGAYSDWR